MGFKAARGWKPQDIEYFKKAEFENIKYAAASRGECGECG